MAKKDGICAKALMEKLQAAYAELRKMQMWANHGEFLCGLAANEHGNEYGAAYGNIARVAREAADSLLDVLEASGETENADAMLRQHEAYLACQDEEGDREEPPFKTKDRRLVFLVSRPLYKKLVDVARERDVALEEAAESVLEAYFKGGKGQGEA